MTNTDDQYGHGTHVTGLITSDQTYIGIAPAVNIVNLRVLDQNGNGTDAEVIQGIQAAVSLAKTYNIRIINLSLGRPVFESYSVDPFCEAVEQAWKAGIVVVVAAGNGGRNKFVARRAPKPRTSLSTVRSSITAGSRCDL